MRLKHFLIPLMVLAQGAVTAAADRDCRALPSAESPAPRVRCEDTGDEYFFLETPFRRGNAPAWLCSTVEARLASDPAQTTPSGSLQTVSIETREERDRRTQMEDLLLAAQGKPTRCWNPEGIRTDNPRLRAEKETREREAREREEQAKAEAERIERILRPHHRTPRNPSEVLIQRTTPAHEHRDSDPQRLELCFALDRSSSMAGTYREIARNFATLAEAWQYHYPAGVRITVLGLGQSSSNAPYAAETLLENGSSDQLSSLLLRKSLTNLSYLEPAIDAVNACASRLGSSGSRRTSRRIILATDEAGDRVPGTPDGLILQRSLRAFGIALDLLDPHAGGCLDTLSNSASEDELTSRFARLRGSRDSFFRCSTSALRYAFWHGQAAAELERSLAEQSVSYSPQQLWESGAEVSSRAVKAIETLVLRIPGKTLPATILRGLGTQADYLEERASRLNGTEDFFTLEFLAWAAEILDRELPPDLFDPTATGSNPYFRY